MSEARELRSTTNRQACTEARELRDYEQRGAACKRRVNCATTNAFMEVYDILNVRGAMNCATTNKEVRELRDYERVLRGV